MQYPVLVVGAGPVGLTAAINLANFNVPVRIIDSRTAPSKLSKALVIWQRSMLTLDPLYTYDHWLQQGRLLGGLSMADNGAVFASLNMKENGSTSGNPSTTATGARSKHMIPSGVMITQSQLEAGLEAQLQDKYGVSVERSTQLESFTVDEASGQVRCILSTTHTDAPDPTVVTWQPKEFLGNQQPLQGPQQVLQQQQEVMASYLIGCDGARSTVRKGLGVPFNGFSDPNNRFLMIDATYEHVPGINTHTHQQDAEALPTPDRLFVSTSAVGLVGVIPVVDSPDTIRVIWNVGPDGPAEPSLDAFQAILMQHTRLQIRLKDVLWQSSFIVNERQVDSYVHHGGRVLLAGDAAHVHTPAGGQGMNTGIQDASNLAWKVALAAAGDVVTGPHLLQTYHEERHPVGEGVLRLSGMLLRANAIRHPVLRFLRRVVLGFVIRLPPLRQRFISTLAEDTVSYTSSSLSKPAPAAAAASAGPAASLAGTAFPDVCIHIDGVTRPATDMLRGSKGCMGSLVLLTPPAAAGSNADGGQTSSTEGTAQGSGVGTAWPTHWGHWPLHVAAVARQGGGSAEGGVQSVSGGAVDAEGLLAAAVHGADGVLVRPDGIVAAAGGPGGVQAWLDGHGFKCN